MAWEEHYDAEREFIAKLFNRGFPGKVEIVPPPTRAETIKHIWEKEGRRRWPTTAGDDGLWFADALAIIEPVHFEQMRYGDVMVIEAEGVIVERTPIAS